MKSLLILQSVVSLYVHTNVRFRLLVIISPKRKFFLIRIQKPETSFRQLPQAAVKLIIFDQNTNFSFLQQVLKFIFIDTTHNINAEFKQAI